MLLTSRQQVVRVGLVEFGERHDTWAATQQASSRNCYEEVTNILVTSHEEVTDLSGVLRASPTCYREDSDKLATS